MPSGFLWAGRGLDVPRSRSVLQVRSEAHLQSVLVPFLPAVYWEESKSKGCQYLTSTKQPHSSSLKAKPEGF